MNAAMNIGADQTPTNEFCEHCKHWKEWEVQPASDRMAIGDCRKNEPQCFQTGDVRFGTKWPSTRATDFCGKFKLKSA